MVRFKTILEKLNQPIKDDEQDEDEVDRGLPRDADNNSGPDWSRLESAIQRGVGEEVLMWMQEWDHNHQEQDQQDIFKPRFIRRWGEAAGRLALSPLQLAVLERKREVVGSLIKDLTKDQLLIAVTSKVLILEEKVLNGKSHKRSSDASKRLFSGAISLISIPGSSSSSPVSPDWSCSMEWSAIHLAVMQDVECLKLLLYTLQHRLDHTTVDNILQARDSRGRSLLHLAARNGTTSSPVKLLLDSGAKVNSVDDYLATVLHMAVKYGVLDSVKELIEHGADKDRCAVDISGRGVLYYAHSPDILRYLLSLGYQPDLAILKYQTSTSRGEEKVKVLLESSVWLEGDLLILDFSLAMEQDRDGDLTTDGESLFLRNFLVQRSLLHVPLVEALLQMKWFACRRVILADLLFYMFFIFCLTGVICMSTRPGQSPAGQLTGPESELVDLVLKNYRSELERRGWKYYPRSTSYLDKYIYNIPDNFTHPEVATVIELSEESSGYSSFWGLYSFTVFLSGMFVLRECLELVALRPRRYFSSVENIFEVFIICLTVLCQIFLQFYSDNVYFYEILQVMTVFFGWLGLTFHLAKLPTVGIYIFLAVKVFRELLLSLLVFTTILLAFAFSFHLAMRKHHVFDNPFTSFLKMINMMAGEYNFDYNFTFNSVRGVGGSNGIVQLLLISFILLVTITIANLIIAIVIANVKKLMEEADAHQLGKTVDLLSTVHNVKQALIRIFPCLKHVFAPTLYDYTGRKNRLCVRLDEVNARLRWLTRLQNAFRSSETFHPVYTYDAEFRRAGELTDLTLPDKIVQQASSDCKHRDRDNKQANRLEGNTEDYSSDWRLSVEAGLQADLRNFHNRLEARTDRFQQNSR